MAVGRNAVLHRADLGNTYLRIPVRPVPESSDGGRRPHPAAASRSRSRWRPSPVAARLGGLRVRVGSMVNVKGAVSQFDRGNMSPRLFAAARTVAAEKPKREGRTHGHGSRACREPVIRVNGAVSAWR